MALILRLDEIVEIIDKSPDGLEFENLVEEWDIIRKKRVEVL